MMRVATIALVLVAIFSITYVLVSPDCGDDVDSVLRPNHLIKSPRSVAGSLSQSQIPAIVAFHLGTLPRFIQPVTISELLDLVCARRC